MVQFVALKNNYITLKSISAFHVCNIKKKITMESVSDLPLGLLIYQQNKNTSKPIYKRGYSESPMNKN